KHANPASAFPGAAREWNSPAEIKPNPINRVIHPGRRGDPGSFIYPVIAVHGSPSLLLKPGFYHLKLTP
ncbi:MAG: hypothetical protein ABSE06_17165, partial [Anaerolineaceae bacterium]